MSGKNPAFRLGLFRHAGRDQHDRISGTNDNRAVRLFGHFARFERNDAAAQINFNFVNHSCFKNLQLTGNQIPARAIESRVE